MSSKRAAVAARPREIVLLALAALAALGLTAPPQKVTASSATARPGDVVRLTVAGAAEPVRIRAFGRDIPAYPIADSRQEALIGVDLEVPPGPGAIEIESGEQHATYPLRVVARRFASRRLTVDPAFVNPPASELPRIERERKELEDLWRTVTPERFWEGPFASPVPEPANSAFGTRTILNGQPRSPHAGADFSSAAGTPVTSPNAGRVVVADALYYTGNTIVVDHGLGLYSLFAHLTDLRARAGDAVKTGDVIGTVGSTGRVTGPHLHWSVRLNGARIDPVVLLRVLRANP